MMTMRAHNGRALHVSPTMIPVAGQRVDETKKHCLLVINDGPYGNERAYNGLRLAMDFARRPPLVHFSRPGVALQRPSRGIAADS